MDTWSDFLDGRITAEYKSMNKLQGLSRDINTQFNDPELGANVVLISPEQARMVLELIESNRKAVRLIERVIEHMENGSKYANQPEVLSELKYGLEQLLK